MDVFGWFLRGAVVLVGRLVGYLLGSRRAVTAKRREVRALALAEAYRKIVRAGAAATPSELGVLDEALMDIQLLGTKAQASRAADIARAVNSHVETDTAVDALLESVRRHVRLELELDLPSSPLVRVRRSLDSAPMSRLRWA